MKSLTEKLVSIRTREELLVENEALEEQFDSLVALVIEGWERYSSNTNEEKKPLKDIDHTLSIQLEAEMARVSQIDADLLQGAYKGAHTKLHIYLQKHQ